MEPTEMKLNPPTENPRQSRNTLVSQRRSLSNKCRVLSLPVLRIRDVYLESRIRIFSIPDKNFFHLGSRVKKINGSRIRIRIKELKYFNPKYYFSDYKIMKLPNPEL
jgi:hypothetical protein